MRLFQDMTCRSPRLTELGFEPESKPNPKKFLETNPNMKSSNCEVFVLEMQMEHAVFKQDSECLGI